MKVGYVSIALFAYLFAVSAFSAESARESGYERTDSGYESCYNLNYRFGRCVAMAQNGYPCKPEDDFVMPERCRGGADADRGLKAGMESINPR